MTLLRTYWRKSIWARDLWTYWRRIIWAVVWFFWPSLLFVLVGYLAILLGKGEWRALPLPPGDKDYVIVLLTAAGIFTLLASVQVQIYHTLLQKGLNLLSHECEFTRLAAWSFAGCVPPILILLGVGVSGWNFFWIKTFVAALQYLIFLLFSLGWLWLYAASLIKPVQKRETASKI